ncbi:MAG: ankyrin repeat domain-containing protein [Alphaproteobacteria bacterium]
MARYIYGDPFAKTIGQLVWLPCMIVKDLFQKPTSRKLGERLTTAVVNNMQTCARYALAKGAFANTKDSDYTMLARAAGGGKTGLVRMLLKAGADPNLQSPNGHTPLIAAASEGRTGAALLLLKSGANAQQADQFGMTPLHAAAYGGHPGIVAGLLKAGVDVLEPCFGNGSSGNALDVARKKDYHDVVALLEPAVQAALAAQSGAPAAPAGQTTTAAGGFNPAAAPAAINVMEPIKLKAGTAPSSPSTP